MLQTCDVGFMSRGRWERASDVGCCTQHESQRGRNIVATWGRGRKTPDVGRCT
jgi:hypothetical protein